jgi:hypothetical protein
LYSEAVQTVGVLANPKDHSEEERKKAEKRFRELYVAELSLVEAADVEGEMVEFAGLVDQLIPDMDAKQSAAYELAHALRDFLVKSWGIDQSLVDNPHH